MPLFTATGELNLGTMQSWVVPETATWIIEAAGGEGGTVGQSYPHGAGARISGEFVLEEGDELIIVVGQQAGTNTANGGQGGGGGSFVAKVDPTGDEITAGPYAGKKVIPLIVAGGGMGEPNLDESVATWHGRADNRGVAHQSVGNSHSSGAGGGGGWSLDGGGNTAHRGFAFLNGAEAGAGTWAEGGFGGGGSKGSSYNDGAGGGGYDGGDHSYENGGHGGGGSYNAGTNQLNLAGDDVDGNFGDGWVNIYAPTVVAGTIYDETGTPCQRAVYAMTRPTDGSAPQLLYHTLSDPVTGEYELVFNTSEEVTRIVIAEDAGEPGPEDPVYNDICDRVIPG